jgi:hypothetical protein
MKINNSPEVAMSTRREKGEVIGGGWFVFRRGKRTNRISVRHSVMPFEHASEESATTEACRLKLYNPNERYGVFKQVKEI